MPSCTLVYPFRSAQIDGARSNNRNPFRSTSKSKRRSWRRRALRYGTGLAAVLKQRPSFIATQAARLHSSPRCGIGHGLPLTRVSLFGLHFFRKLFLVRASKFPGKFPEISKPKRRRRERLTHRPIQQAHETENLSIHPGRSVALSLE